MKQKIYRSNFKNSKINLSNDIKKKKKEKIKNRNATKIES